MSGVGNNVKEWKHIMEFQLSEEQIMLRDTVRRWCKEEVAPLAQQAEEEGAFPIHVLHRAGELGFLCVDYPEAFGGGGMDLLTECLVAEEIGRYGGVGIGGSLMVQSGLGTRLILAHGTDEQCQKYLVPATRGEKIAAFALTEPNAGSDVASIATTAVRQGDHYVLNGSKVFITNGTVADFSCVAAYTDKSKGPKGGMSVLIVDEGAHGFTAVKMNKHVSRSSDTAEYFFDDCKVPAANLVGEEGQGFGYVMETLYPGRVSHAARSVGLAQACLDLSLQYATQRVQFGRPISKFQAIKFKLAEMASSIEAARRLTHWAAWCVDTRTPGYRAAASSAKLFASEVAQQVSSEAMQIFGGYGITKDYPIYSIFAGLRLATVTEGTSEIQKLIIARELGI